MAPDASHGPARNAALDPIKNVVGEKGWSDDLNDHVSYVNAFRGRLGRQDGTARPSRLNARSVGGHDHLRRREDARRPAG